MSDEKIYTNSQVEQVKYEIREDIAVLKNKIKNIEFVTETLKVSDVKNTIIDWHKVKIAYRIDGHYSQSAEYEYAYPVIYYVGVVGIPRFFVFDPTNPNKFVELTDDDTLKVSYMVEKNLE